MSTTPKPYTLDDVDGGAFTWDGDDEVLQRIRATVEALDAAQARVKELESDPNSNLLLCNRVKELEAERSARDGLTIDGRSMLMAMRDEKVAALARAEKAEAELAEVRHVLDREYVSRHEFAKTLEERESALAERNFARGDQETAEAALTESRASEARMREALEKLESGVWDRLYAEGPLSKEYAQSIAKQVKDALSAPVSDWLAARDRRVAEVMIHRVEALRAVPLASADFLAGIERVVKTLRSPPTTTAVDAAPLVEFKPEGET